MVYFRTRKKVNVNEAKTHLSALVGRAAAGESVVICRRNVPVAELRSLPQSRRTPRPIGLVHGFQVPASFFDPLPDDLIGPFEGR